MQNPAHLLFDGSLLVFEAGNEGFDTPQMRDYVAAMKMNGFGAAAVVAVGKGYADMAGYSAKNSLRYARMAGWLEVNNDPKPVLRAR